MHTSRGYVLSKMSQHERASAEFSTALDLNAGKAAIYLAWAACYLPHQDIREDLGGCGSVSPTWRQVGCGIPWRTGKDLRAAGLRVGRMKKSVTSMLVPAVLLVFAAFLAYFPGLRADFVWDDLEFAVGPLTRLPDGLYYYWFTSAAPDYFPLTSTTFWVEWRLWGRNPCGYHVVNILLHGLGATLLWRILLRLMVPGGWVAALVFAVHPVNVSSVAWITERKNTLSLVFYALSLLAYLRWEDEKWHGWYALSLFTFLLAALSKSSVVMLPVVLLLCAWWRQGRVGKRALWSSAPYFVLAGIFALVSIWFQTHRVIGSEVVRPERFLSRLAAAGWAVWFYLGKILLPHNLMAVYPRWQVDADRPVAYLPGILLVATVLALWHLRRKIGRGGLFGLKYFVVTLFPVLGFFDIYFMRYSLVADHWQYLANIGIVALVVGVVAARWRRLSGEWQAAGITATCIIFGALCVLTWGHNMTYKSHAILARDTVRKNPKSWVMYINLAVERNRRGWHEMAAALVDHAVHLNPRAPQVLTNYAARLQDGGKYEEALKLYRETTQEWPNYAAAYSNLGDLLYYLGRYEEAIAAYNQLLRLSRWYADGYYRRGLAYLALGDKTRALADFSQAITLEPRHAMAFNERGSIRDDLGQHDAAIADFTRAIAISPHFALAYYNRGVAYLRKEDHHSAAADFTEALRWGLKSAAVYYNRAVCYFHLKQFDEAWADVHAYRTLGGTVPADFFAALQKASGRNE